MSIRLSKILAKNMLESKYIKDGYLSFDRIDIVVCSYKSSKVNFYLEGRFLVSMEAAGNVFPDSTITFHLTDGNMKMEFANEDICEVPKEDLQSQISEIWDVIRRL